MERMTCQKLQKGNSHPSLMRKVRLPAAWRSPKAALYGVGLACFLTCQADFV